jgi:sphingomyelin phosphodiesterase acid-like 3
MHMHLFKIVHISQHVAFELFCFNQGGYYTSLLTSKCRLISVNSNLWYTSDHVFDNSTTDPADQFHWLEHQMLLARNNGEKV